jgi:hypothetical protein
LGIKHATQTSRANNPDYDVSKDAWNENHTIDGTVTPDTDDSHDLGSATAEWKDLYVDGKANIDDADIGQISADLLPDSDDSRDLGSSSKEWKDLYVDGTAYIDALADGVTLGGDAICKIKTGTYTGDGTISQSITGVGFAPLAVYIHAVVAAGGPYEDLWSKWANTSGSLAWVLGADGNHYLVDNGLISLDADGFTVDDGANDGYPNTNLQVFEYLALG